MTDTLEAFRHFREKMNAAILAADNLTINRFFALDTRTYEAGALPAKTKELLGLVMRPVGVINCPHPRDETTDRMKVSATPMLVRVWV